MRFIIVALALMAMFSTASGEIIDGDLLEMGGLGLLGGLGAGTAVGNTNSNVNMGSVMAQLANLDNVDGDMATQIATQNIMKTLQGGNTAGSSTASTASNVPVGNTNSNVNMGSIMAQLANLDNVDGDMATQIATQNIMNQMNGGASTGTTGSTGASSGGVNMGSIMAQLANLDNVDGDLATQIATQNIFAQLQGNNGNTASTPSTSSSTSSSSGTTTSSGTTSGTTTASSGTTNSGTATSGTGTTTSSGSTTTSNGDGGTSTSTSGTTAGSPSTATSTSTSSSSSSNNNNNGLSGLALASLLDGDAGDLFAMQALAGGNLGGGSGGNSNLAGLAVLGGSGDMFTAQVLSQGVNPNWLLPKASYSEAIDGDVRENMQKMAQLKYMGGLGGAAGALGMLPTLQKSQPAQPTHTTKARPDPVHNFWFWAFLVNCMIISSAATFFFLNSNVKGIQKPKGYSMYEEQATEKV